MRKRDMRTLAEVGNIKHFAPQAANLPGDVAEFGVYIGGSAGWLCRLFPDKTIHLFDSCDGLPQSPGEHDGDRPGGFRATAEKIAESLSGYGNWTLHDGWFADTLAEVETGPLAFAHVDCDYEQSYRDCLPYILERLVPGGVLLIDDYNSMKCKGANIACDAILGGREGFRDLARRGAVYVNPGAGGVDEVV